MSNMSPQLPNLNRGVWKGLEASTRAWAWVRKHNLTVYAGNIYEVGKSKTIGQNKVVVPDALYKIIIDGTTGESMAFIFRQVEKQPTDPLPSAVSIAAVETITGVTFPVPSDLDKSAVVKSLWPVDFGAQASAKKETCRVK
jgi:endonuclease G